MCRLLTPHATGYSVRVASGDSRPSRDLGDYNANATPDAASANGQRSGPDRHLAATEPADARSDKVCGWMHWEGKGALMVYVIVNGCHLFEMTQADFDHSRAHNGEDYQRIVHHTKAHEWVKAGNPHSTSLWVDDTGRIRRA